MELTERNFITRYYIYRTNDNNEVLGLDDLCTLFENDLQKVFYKFFDQLLVSEEKISELALEEMSNNNKKLFKTIEVTKENDDTIFGKIVFSDFEEKLDSSITLDENNKKISSDGKFIPRRTFFFMLKIFAENKLINKGSIGVLMLHKRGARSVLSYLKKEINKIKKDSKIEIKSLTFEDELGKMEELEISKINVLVKKPITDYSEEVRNLGIEEFSLKKDFKIKKGIKGITNQLMKFAQLPAKEYPAFYFDIETDLVEVTLKDETHEKVFCFSEGTIQEKIPSIVLDEKKVYNKEKELDWEKIKEEFTLEMDNCVKKIYR